jgi:hypothetical protein
MKNKHVAASRSMSEFHLGNIYGACHDLIEELQVYQKARLRVLLPQHKKLKLCRTLVQASSMLAVWQLAATPLPRSHLL